MYYHIFFAALLTVALGAAIEENRIVGGESVNIVNFPYQISLFYNDHHMCGGAILNSNFVLTAAHCVERAIPLLMKVYAGMNNIYNTVDYSTVHTGVSSILVHPGFTFTSFGTVRNDIALVRMHPPLQLNQQSLPVGIAHSEPKSGEFATVTGYGVLNENGRTSGGLMGVTVPIVDKSICNKTYAEYGIDHINEEVICAGYLEGGKDACQGDSGGPAVVNGKLVGIVSYGLGCARPNIPGIYTNVAHYRKWINDNLA